MYEIITAENPGTIHGDITSINFIELLKSRWDKIHDLGDVFRYKIDKLQEVRRIVGGKYVLQLNNDRGVKRRMPELIDNFSQPFDKNKFNFTKVSTNEILFGLIKQGNESEVHSIIVNVSPISCYHALLCPSLSKCHPQVVTEDSLLVALDIMLLAQHRYLRIGFNSLCALASVNHLHYHLFIEHSTLPVETAKCIHLKGSLYRFRDYVAPAFCFQIQSQHSVKESSKQIFKLLSYFLSNSIAHNIFITRGESLVPGDDKQEVVRVIIWPRKSCSGAKRLVEFNVAVCELSGWFPVYDKTVYETLKTENLEHELRKWNIDHFDVLCEEVKSLF